MTAHKPHRRARTENVRVECWCQQRFVAVPADDYRTGRRRSASCGDPLCNEDALTRYALPLDTRSRRR